MSKNTDEIKVFFAIFSDTVSPSAITQKLGIYPDEEWQKGTCIHGNVVRKTNYWAISAAGSNPGDFQQAMKTIIERLIPIKEKLLGISTECNFELSCVILVNDGPTAPGIHFGIDELQFFSSIRTEIDIDVYCLSQP